MKKPQKNQDTARDLMEKIFTLRETIEEEYDLMELIEDSIKEVFECDLDCSTCSSEEQGFCMQKFKKANLYWIRKVAQDEWALKNFVDKIGELYELIERLMGIIIKDLKSPEAKDEFDKIVDEREKIESKEVKNNSMFM